MHITLRKSSGQRFVVICYGATSRNSANVTMVDELPKASPDLRHANLLSFMTPEFSASVVENVLEHKDKLPSDVRRKLDLAIRAVAKVPRFPYQPERAPAPLLRQPIVDQLVDSGPLTNSIFESWFLSNETLYAIIKSHLFARNIDVDYPDFKEHKFRGTWSYDDWMSTRDDISSAHTDLPIDDLALMLCFATDRTPADFPNDFQGDKEDMYDNILDQARRYLEILPADSPEWSIDVPHFLTAVSEIVDKKERERQSFAAVRALNLQMAELDQYRDKLNYLELDTSSWRVSTDLPVVNVAEASDQFQELMERLRDYDPEPQKGSSLSETQRLREEHDKAYRVIQELKDNIDQKMAIQPESAEPDCEIELEEDIEVGDPELALAGGISDIRVSEGTLAFNPSHTYYSLEVDNTVELLAITPLTNRGDATINVSYDTPDGETIEAAKLEAGEFLVSPLPVGRTTISVTFRDSDDRKTYTLSVTRGKESVAVPILSSDATLRSLSVSAMVIEFNPEVTHYSFDLNEGTDSFIIQVEPTHESASVSVVADLSDGTTVEVAKAGGDEFLLAPEMIFGGDIALSVTVMAEDKATTQVYTVVAKRETAPDPAEYIWKLVAQDDLAGAYWLARAIVAKGYDPPVTPQLLKAVQGSRLLSPNSGFLVEDLFYIVGESEISDYGDTAVLLRLAAGLVPSLASPETNLLAWVAVPNCFPGLDAVVSPVKAYANTGHALRPEHVSGDEGNQQLQGLIARASAEARQWLEEVPQNQTRFTRAVRVLQYFCREGAIHEMLTPVAEDDRGQINTVRNCVNQLDRSDYAELINLAESSMGVRSAKSSQIVGNARDWLVNRIDEAKIRANSWLSLVSRESEGRSDRSDDWLQEQVSILRGQLQTEIPSVLEGLLELSSDDNPPALAASAKCVTRSVQQLMDYLDLDAKYEIPLPTSDVVHQLGAISAGVANSIAHSGEMSGLEYALSLRLLCVPSVNLNDNGLPYSDDSLIDLANSPSNLDINSMTLEEVMLRRLDNHDFRFFELLRYGLSSDAAGQLNTQFQSELASERKTLLEEVESTQDAVEQAEKDGVIEFEGSLWTKHKSTLDDVNVEGALDFTTIYHGLDAIRRELNEERIRRGQELLEEWQALESQLDLESDDDREFFKEVESTFEMARKVDSLDIRVMEDCVSRVRNRRSGEEEYLARTEQEELRHGTLEKFQEFSRAIGDPKAHVRSSEGLRSLMLELRRPV